MSKFICSIDLFGDSEKDILETSETRSREAVRIPGLGKAALGTEVILKGLTLEGPILLKIGQHFFFFFTGGRIYPWARIAVQSIYYNNWARG